MRNTIVKRAIFILGFALLILFASELRSEALTFPKQWSNSEIAENGNVQATLYSNGTLVISGNGAMKNWNPDSNKAPWFVMDRDGYYADSIKRVHIESGVTSIGNYAFCDSEIRDVNIQGTNVKIGEGAFQNSKVNTIFRETEEDYCKDFISGDYVENRWHKGISVSIIGEGAFQGCGTLQNLSIGEECTKIEGKAFQNCANLEQFRLEETSKLTSIGNNAFDGCSNLSEFLFGPNLQEIGSYAFKNCQNFRDIVIQNKDLKIGTKAFEGCNCSIYGYPDSTAEGYANANSMSFVTIETEEDDVWNIAKDGSDSLIAKYSERNGRGILEIEVKEGIEGPIEMKDWNLNNQDMPRWVQAPYSQLIRQINFSGNISNIGDYAFFDLTNVKKIEIPYGVEHIGFGNFDNCNSLETLLLPPSLRVLDNMEIYYNGTGLTVKGFRGTPAENVSGSKNVRITFYDKTETWDLSVDKNESVTGCLDYVSGTLTISGNGVMADFGDGANRAPWINRINWYDSRNLYTDWIKKVVIKDEIRNLGDSCFKDLENITFVMIPESVTDIGSNVFAGCDKLVSVIFLHISKQNAVAFDHNMFVGIDTTQKVQILCIEGSSVDEFFKGTGISYSYLEGYDISATDGDSSVMGYVLPISENEYMLYARGKGNIKSYNGDLSWTYPFQDGEYPPWLSKPLYYSTIKKIVIEDGVTGIGKNSFRWLTYVESIEIADSVKIIQDKAFLDCNSLKNLVLPSRGLTDIGKDIFYDNSNQLEQGKQITITINDVQGDGRWYSKENGDDVFIDWNNVGEKDSDVKAIFNYREGKLQITGEGAIKGGPLPWSASQANVKVNTVEIDDKITKIGTQAFAGLNDMTNVTIGNAVNIIGAYAFQNCSKLTSLELRNVTKVGNYAFSNCSSLNSISKSELGAWSLGENAFSNCSNLKTVNSKELFAVSGNTFKDCNEALVLTWYELQQPTIPYYKISYEFKDKTLKLLYENGYVGEKDYQLSNDNRPSWNRESFAVNIQSVVIGEGIKRIGNEAFKGMSRIENVSIPNSITSIGDGSFAECRNLTKVEIPNQVKTIGNNAFSGCNIGELVIPNSVTILKAKAFSGNPIQTIEFKGTDCEISDNVFEACNLLKTVKMHNGRNYVSKNAFGSDNENNFTIEWKDGEINVVFYNQLKSLMVTAPDGNKNYQMADWYTATNGGRYPPWSKNYFKIDTKHIGIGERIQNVGLQSFYGLDKVESVEISDTVTTIASYAFANCSSLQNIIIPYSVNSLGMEAFSGCTKLSKVEIYNPEMIFKTDIFKNCDKEKLLMRGYEDSTAHDYARENNIKFEPFDWKYCRVEFYYDGTIDDSLTWKYQVIDLSEPINENTEIIQKAKQRGQKNGFKYGRFETQLGEMSKNNVIKLFYTATSEPPVFDEEIEYVVNFYNIKNNTKIMDISGGTVKGNRLTILNSREYLDYKKEKLGKKYTFKQETKDDLNKVIHVYCREHIEEDDITKNYTVNVYLNNWENQVKSIENRVKEKPTDVDVSISLQTVIEEVLAQYSNYRLFEKIQDDDNTQIKVLLKEKRDISPIPPDYEETEYVVDFYHSDTGKKIQDISGSRVKGYGPTIQNSTNYLLLKKEKLGEKYTFIKQNIDLDKKVITVWCRNRNPSDSTNRINYTVRVYLNNWNNQVKSIANKVKETPDNVSTSESLQMVIEEDILAVYTDYAFSEMEQDDEKAEIRVLLTQIPTTYTIKYYYDNKEQDKETETCLGMVGDVVTKEMIQTHIDAHKNGYKFSKTENLPLTLKANVANNVIKVYYTKDGSTNLDPGGSSNGNGNGSNGGASSSTGTSSKGNGKSITGNPSDSLASKIIPKTGVEVGLLVGIIALSGVAIVCYKKSRWN